MSSNAPEEPAAAERETVSNRFCNAANLAVHYNGNKSLFSGTWREDLIIRHVVAARLASNRHAIRGALLALIGVIWLFGGMAAQSGAAIVAIIPWAAGILLFRGSPMVSATAADGVAGPSVSWPRTRFEVEEFVNGVSKELLARG